MNDYMSLANLLFPDVKETPEDLEKRFPERNLKEGARVTRLAPSPTGFLHFGNLFTGTVAFKTAKVSDGIFFVRVEDTDQKRKIEGAVEIMLDGLKTFGVTPDEGVVDEGKEIGDYGPYYQSQRKPIYHVLAKSLVEQGLAYPCFCSAEELDEIREKQEGEPQKGYWGKYAKCRDLTLEEIEKNISEGKTWTLRLRSPGDAEKKCFFDDMIKGKIEMPENVQDVVLLKSDGIPTYHFAHAVDDHLMRTTHVIRGDEWISSVPIHIQLFKCLGFKVPKFAHVSPIMKEDEETGGKRKLSKRKDPEAAVSYYGQMGYPMESVNEYIMTLANSNFEDWRKVNKDAPLESFPFNLKKMSVSGALFDMRKLADISKNIISVMSAEKVYDYTAKWAERFDGEFFKILTADKEYSVSILNIDRETPKPRKDIACFSEVKDYVSYFFSETYENTFELPENISKETAAEVLEAYLSVYNANDTKDEWFQRMKDMCESIGFTPNVKEYKKNPELYKGHVGDLSTVVRVAVTGRRNTPDLYAIMSLLGEEKVKERLQAALCYFKG